MEATQPIDYLKTKILDCSTAVKALHVILGDVDADDLRCFSRGRKKVGASLRVGWQFMNLARRSVGTKRSADVGSKRIGPSSKVSSSR